MKSRIRCGRFSRLFVVLTILVMFLINLNMTALAAPELTVASVTPGSGTPDDELLFLIIYYDSDNKQPEYVRLVVDNKRYELSPVNPNDLNYTDGKNYMTRIKLSEGTHIFYFEASNGQENTSSLAYPMRIKPVNEFTHLDVAYSLLIATVMILIPLIYGLYQLKKLVSGLDKLAPRGKSDEKKK